jgi:4,5-dihydroxyphthalate decarboxylase
MSKLALTIACDDYDWLRPLREGRVQVEGIDLNLLTVESGLRHQRMSRHGEYDACEYSMGSYMVARAQGIDTLQAIPFFARRMFCHSFCFIRAGSGITKPADLKGSRIGLLGYQNSLALIVKGMLMHSYGLPVTDVTWVTNREERVSGKLPPSIKIERAEEGRRLEDLLLAGEIDALIEPDLPQAWLQGKGTVARLFPDYEKEERAYYERTRIFPIMHPIVVKKEILDRAPWVATSLYEAFVESRRLHRAFMEQPHRTSVVWSKVEEERRFFGKDPFYQGLRENRHDVETMIQFADEQGMLPRSLGVDELFAETTRGT